FSPSASASALIENQASASNVLNCPMTAPSSITTAMAAPVLPWPGAAPKTRSGLLFRCRVIRPLESDDTVVIKQIWCPLGRNMDCHARAECQRFRMLHFDLRAALELYQKRLKRHAPRKLAQALIESITLHSPQNSIP